MDRWTDNGQSYPYVSAMLRWRHNNRKEFKLQFTVSSVFSSQ